MPRTSAGDRIDPVVRDALAGLMLLCAKQGDAEAIDRHLAVLEARDALAYIPSYAAYHGLGMSVHRALRKHERAGLEVLHSLRTSYRQHLLSNLRTETDLTELAPVLDRLGVAWVVIKGPVLGEALYGRSGFRSYVDLDVLVEQRRFGDALGALLDSGSRLLETNWDMIARQVRGEVNLVLRHGTVLDFHWNVINDRHVRRGFTMDMDTWLGRRRRLDVNGLSVPALDAEDNLLHLCVHAIRSGAHRLSWFLDIERVIATDKPEWDVVLRRAAENGLGLAAAAMLSRARNSVGADVPLEVVRQLAPASPWFALCRAWDRARPPQATTLAKLSGRSMYKSTRRDTANSLVGLGHTMYDDVLGPALVEQWWRPEDRRPKNLPTPYDAASDPTARARFLDIVTSGRG